MLSAGKVREEVSAVSEHCALFAVSQEIFNQNPQNVPSSMNQQAFSNQSTSHAPLSHIDTCTIITAQEETMAPF